MNKSFLPFYKVILFHGFFLLRMCIGTETYGTRRACLLLRVHMQYTSIGFYICRTSFPFCLSPVKRIILNNVAKIKGFFLQCKSFLVFFIKNTQLPSPRGLFVITYNCSISSYDSPVQAFIISMETPDTFIFRAVSRIPSACP